MVPHGQCSIRVMIGGVWEGREETQCSVKQKTWEEGVKASMGADIWESKGKE